MTGQGRGEEDFKWVSPRIEELVVLSVAVSAEPGAGSAQPSFPWVCWGERAVLARLAGAPQTPPDTGLWEPPARLWLMSSPELRVPVVSPGGAGRGRVWRPGSPAATLWGGTAPSTASLLFQAQFSSLFWRFAWLKTRGK